MASISSRSFAVGLSDEFESPRAARRIICNAEVLKACKLCAGDVVAIASGDKTSTKKLFAVGVVWPSLDNSQDSILISSSLLRTAQLEIGSLAHLYPLAAGSNKLVLGLPAVRQAKEAGVIKVKEITTNATIAKLPGPSRENAQRNWLTLLLKELIVDLKYLTSTQVLEARYEGHLRTFRVASVISKTQAEDRSILGLEQDFDALSVNASPQLWIASWDSKVTILEDGKSDLTESSQKPQVEHLAHKSTSAAYASVGGLGKQIAQIRDLLEIPLIRPDLFRHFGLKPPRGILLHGPPGTGKTHLARAIASSINSAVIVINGPELSSAYHGETEARLRDVFKEARDKSPCIVVLDEVDALAPRREEGAGGEVEKRVVATLLTILDGMEDGGDERVVVVGTTNRPNAIDPALRRPGRFDRELEIGIPDAEARYAILKVLLSKAPHTVTEDALRDLASRAHGYVGADLSAVVREAGTLAIKRWVDATRPADADAHAHELEAPVLTLSDLEISLPNVRASAMRSLFIETPPVRYADIGGQAAVIQQLRQAVEWPLLHPEAFLRLGVKPPKGVLLYGPPGCSKTVLARACASESGINFLAVKGPELLNKFVGESERAVREIFRKARAASPSIIFFDEIDALARSRTSDTDGGASNEGVLTSLLNEMDGVQELLGVTVIAATNRPQAMDTALLRPGRLDRILYVGPPDLAGREEILKIHTQKMSIDENLNISELSILVSCVLVA
ncbi:hypothetical protein HGRIS_005523 [Hohenbuehelia grisea]|uniref:AAA+ ATPase domain-containing protein n=1 Tax=Hohenbuehelia grisea TaxID=104357 RepID=A0ABR3JZD1_9AGAR